MNLLSGYEETPGMFYYATGSLLLLSAIVTSLGLRKLGILRRVGLGVTRRGGRGRGMGGGPDMGMGGMGGSGNAVGEVRRGWRSWWKKEGGGEGGVL